MQCIHPPPVIELLRLGGGGGGGGFRAMANCEGANGVCNAARLYSSSSEDEGDDDRGVSSGEPKGFVRTLPKEASGTGTTPFGCSGINRSESSQ